jgi:hypothetical protein
MVSIDCINGGKSYGLTMIKLEKIKNKIKNTCHYCLNIFLIGSF